MKKKSLFLLASVAMGAALVGGTFASWAVTDNADPFSIKVSTGEVTTDTTEYVTLEWGSQQSMRNVSNLAPNTVRKAGVLDLKASTLSENTPKGKLSYKISGENAANLIAKLEVKIYQGDLAADANDEIAATTLSGKTPLAFTLDEGKYEKDINIDKADLTKNLYTVAVNLATVTPDELKAMDNQKASIEFDWGATDDAVKSVTLYATGFNGAPKAYAWTDATENKAFPGVAMSEVSAGSGVYAVEILSSFKNVIFSWDDDYTNDTNRQQSGDLVIATTFTGTNNMFTYKADVETIHGTISAYDPTSVKTYYVVGSFTSPVWTAQADYKMTLKTGTTDEYELASVNLTAGDKIKVFEKKYNDYYGCASTWEKCGFTLDEDGNLVISETGSYKIHIDLSPVGEGNYVDIAKLTA